MADIMSGERGMGKAGGLEREEGEKEVEVLGHEGDSFFAPGPNGGADIVDLFSLKSFFTERAMEAEIEPGVVDADEGFGIEGEDFAPERIEEADHFWEGSDDIDKTHYLEIFHRLDAFDRKLAHSRAGDGGDFEGWIEPKEFFNEFGSLQIAAGLSGEEKKIYLRHGAS